MLKIFVSHSSKDSDVVEVVVNNLRRLGVKIWVAPENMPMDKPIKDVLSQAIEKKVDLLLVCLSENAQTSEWVEWEEKCALDANRKGHPISTIYAVVSSKTKISKLPNVLTIDLSQPGTVEFMRGLLDISRHLLMTPPFQRLGIKGIYGDYDTLNNERQSEEYTGVDKFLAGAKSEIVGIGYVFETLFGQDNGNGLARFIQMRSNGKVTFFVPDPDMMGANHIASIHVRGQELVPAINRWVKDRFPVWGRSVGLSQGEANRVRLGLLRVAPTHSFLGVDISNPEGRMVVDTYAYGVAPKDQMKVTLRWPSTPLYQRYYHSFLSLTEMSNISRWVATSSK